MATELTWLGHGTWLIKSGETQILLDPFLDDNPAAPVKAADVEADYILVSHGHYDHVSDLVPIARRTGATVIAVFEICEWLKSKHGIEQTLGMNVGGGLKLPFGLIKMTLAFHSSMLPDGTYGGCPVGFLLTLDGAKIFFACDTALYEGMKRLATQSIDLAVLPIGDLFTMGPDDSYEAIRLIKPSRVLPAHYNTWPAIEQDPQAWAKMVRTETLAEPIVLEPGGTVSI